ncbi:hypothetical protein [Algoriphagus kandeliae]|uniref:hypothetical protein n=1 Tax=Algoriphagus kandeliae TaxID=2562278 RepID=UPI001F35B238|nr:hypothetical protein [Algoriphagus kandeliae]
MCTFKTTPPTIRENVFNGHITDSPFGPKPEKEVILRPKIELDSEFKQMAEEYAIQEQQVIVHCRFYPSIFYSPRLRIWPSTFLRPKGSSKPSKLLQAFNISFYPDWKEIHPHNPHDFTLIFEGLPKDCLVFDLIEEIPEPGGFCVRDIKRNHSDVYHIRV